jgi:hypothetical protein
MMYGDDLQGHNIDIKNKDMYDQTLFEKYMQLRTENSMLIIQLNSTKNQVHKLQD